MDGTATLVKSYCSILFAAEERRLAKALRQINDENKAIKQSPCDGFLYDGAFFIPKDDLAVHPGKGRKPSLEFSLVPQMRTLSSDMRTIEQDRKTIGQILTRLITPCTHEQDLRDTLPECLVDQLPDLRKLSRMRPVAFTLPQTDRDQRQFEMILRRMEFYSAARLMY